MTKQPTTTQRVETAEKPKSLFEEGVEIVEVLSNRRGVLQKMNESLVEIRWYDSNVIRDMPSLLFVIASQKGEYAIADNHEHIESQRSLLDLNLKLNYIDPTLHIYHYDYGYEVVQLTVSHRCSVMLYKRFSEVEAFVYGMEAYKLLKN